jgi:isopenicillin-N epimerase
MKRRSFIGASAGAMAAAALAEARTLFGTRIDEVAHAWAGDPHARPSDAYMLGPGVLYLNHGSIGTIPRVVHEARCAYLRLCESNPHLYMWGEPWQEPREEVRQGAAALAGCDPDEVALTHNTTEAFGLLAAGLDLAPGDEVLFSSLNHDGASAAWQQQAARRGYTVRRFDFPVADLPGLTPEDVVELHLREIGERTRVLVFPHVDNIVGLRHPLRALAHGAKARGVEYVAVDGAQALGMLPVSLADSGVDVYAASPHKWLQAPKGTGFLFVRSGVQEHIHPSWVTWRQEGWAGSARVFEDYGTRNLPEVLTLGDALRFHRAVDPSDREARHHANWVSMLESVDAAPSLSWHSSRHWELSASLAFVGTRNDDPFAVAARHFAEHGAVYRPFRTQGVSGARVSPNLQTPGAEITRVLELLAG